MKHLALITLALLLHCLTFAQENDTVITVPSPEGPLPTELPLDLKPLMLNNPYVDLLVLLDASGTVEARLPLYATHHELLKPALKLIDSTEFEPAQENGNPIPIRFSIRVVFKDLEQEIWKNTGKIPQGDNIMAGSHRRLTDAELKALAYQITEIPELDQPLQLQSGGLVVVQDQDGNPSKGRAYLEYFIDSQGNALLPTILECDNEWVGLSAIESIKKLKFSPLTHEDIPTFVQVRQWFNFGNQSTEPQP